MRIFQIHLFANKANIYAINFLKKFPPTRKSSDENVFTTTRSSSDEEVPSTRNISYEDVLPTRISSLLTHVKNNLSLTLFQFTLSHWHREKLLFAFAFVFTCWEKYFNVGFLWIIVPLIILTVDNLDYKYFLNSSLNLNINWKSLIIVLYTCLHFGTRLNFLFYSS